MPNCVLSLVKWSEALIKVQRLGGFDQVVLDNNILRLIGVPEIGGKIVSLVRQESGYEYLLQKGTEREYQRPVYGDNFENGDASGFDECVPTIAKCMYPEAPLLGKRLCDHGDVWCTPSSFEVIGEQVRFITSLSSLPLRFTKCVQLAGNRVRLDYEITNLSKTTLKFLWSAHPLLNVRPQAQIVLPPEVNEVELSWSKGERLGQSGNRCRWPDAKETSGRTVDLSRVLHPSAATADKLFTPRLSTGFCGLFLPDANESIAFHFDPELIPHLGIWICQGGWPTSGATTQFTVALEPCTGRPDSLEEAIRREECSVVGSSGTKHWWLEIEVAAGAVRSW